MRSPKSKLQYMLTNGSVSQGFTAELISTEFYTTFFETNSLPWDFPVEINCFEASAYCRWLSKKGGKAFRLPTEDEHYAMLKHIKYDFKKD